MKKFLILLAISVTTAFHAFSQDYSYVNPGQIRPMASSVFLGFSSGINNNTGLLGPTLEYRLNKDLTIFAGAGIGTWGFKYSIGGRYYTGYPDSWAFGLGFSAATGAERVEIDMEDGLVVGATGTQRVPVRLNTAKTLNATALKFWTLGRSGKNRFNIEMGYGFKVGPKPYTILDNSVLTREGNFLMNFMRPGGVILGMGFSFGLN